MSQTGNIQPSLDHQEHSEVANAKRIVIVDPTNSDAGLGDNENPLVTLGRDEKIVYASDATYEYFAFAPPGSSTASAVWKVIRIDGDGQKTHADGNADYDNVATSIESLTYS